MRTVGTVGDGEGTVGDGDGRGGDAIRIDIFTVFTLKLVIQIVNLCWSNMYMFLYSPFLKNAISHNV